MNYAQIRSMDISNGEGIGISLFVQGCHFHCYNCFNQETWDFNDGEEWTEDIKYDLFKHADQPYISRLSILGGEPLATENLEAVLDLVTEFNMVFPDKSIWLYSGYQWEDFFGVDHWMEKYEFDRIDINTHGTYSSENMLRRLIIVKCKVFVDGRYIDSESDLSLSWRGSKNQRVIDVRKSMREGKVILYDKNY